MQRLLSSITQANAKRKRLKREAEQLLKKQKKMVIQEASALDALDHTDLPLQASSIVLVSIDDTQLEEVFNLALESLANYLGPIPLDRLVAQ